MASNVVSIRKRMDTVETVSKITNAMKLISITRYQKYRRLNEELKAFVEAVESITSQEENMSESNSKSNLNIFIGSDLGLVSSYMNKLIDKLKELSDEDKVFWIGGNQYERIKKIRPDLLNQKPLLSEELDVPALYKQVLSWSKTYQIRFCYPSQVGEELVLNWKTLDTKLHYSDLILYEPSYEEVNERYQSVALLASLYKFYYQAKSVEYMMRRVAMDQATDNAQDMKEDLEQEFNRIRQEEITLEIQELSVGVIE